MYVLVGFTAGNVIFLYNIHLHNQSREGYHFQNNIPYSKFYKVIEIF